MILVGDIGGTNTRIGLFDQQGDTLKLAREHIFSSREHESLNQIVAMFLREAPSTARCACFGIAGPVLNGRVTASNLAWVVDAGKLASETAIEKVWLINDLEAHAYGINDLDPADLITLNPGTPTKGNAAIVAAGTGMGEAGLFWNGKQHYAFAGEGGHADFAPGNELELALHGYLTKKFGHVSCERVISGPGIKNIYDFLRDSKIEEEPAWLKEELDDVPDPAVLISRYGLEGKPPICDRTLDIFAGAYGAEAGNVALRMLAVNGVYISGGIASKTMTKIKDPLFLGRFLDKGRMRSLLENVPVKVIVNEHIGMLGAARYALQRASGVL
ncbi:MAG TPA: glucokinase [Candidatus Angelobacter sp.]|nr:glucokinase [Candidatus Angelobacter sp.]